MLSKRGFGLQILLPSLQILWSPGAFSLLLPSRLAAATSMELLSSAHRLVFQADAPMKASNNGSHIKRLYEGVVKYYVPFIVFAPFFNSGLDDEFGIRPFWVFGNLFVLDCALPNLGAGCTVHWLA